MLLRVNYYGEYTLDSIPMGWQVKVAGVTQTLQTYDGGNPNMRWLTITETDSVELIPPADVKPNVKSVTLVEPVAVQTVTVDGLQINYVEGENWVQTAERNPALDISGGHIFKYGFYILTVAGGGEVSATDTYSSSLSYHWQEY
jgi:hypothetical protein